mgnify:CR=1 FL=1
MEITNRINVPKIFLRRLVTWVMREVGGMRNTDRSTM